MTAGRHEENPQQPSHADHRPRVRCSSGAHSQELFESKDRLGRIIKRGDRYIRYLLYVGGQYAIRFAKARAATGEAWIRSLQQRRPSKVVIVALARILMLPLTGSRPGVTAKPSVSSKGLQGRN